jgi:hypothetical protein
MDLIALGKASNIQTAAVSGALNFANNVYSFSASLNIDFIPDFIVLKQIVLSIDGASDYAVCKITSSLVNGDLTTFPIHLEHIYDSTNDNIISVRTGYTVKCDSVFLNKSKNPVRGNFLFTFSQLKSTGPGGDFLISLLFEFIKF